MPLPLVIIGAAAIVVFGAVCSWLEHGKATVTVAVQLPLEVIKTVAAIRAHRATAAEARSAAEQAARYGQNGLATALREEADVLEGTSQAVTGELVADGKVDRYKSPLPGVTDEGWTLYVRRSRIARPCTISPQRRLGAYGMSARELLDVGRMTEVHHDDRVGTWAEGHDLDRFLDSTTEQYDALADLSRLHARCIETQHHAVIGREVEGEKVTLSGLLAVARRTGLGGLRRWVDVPAERFTETTAAYKRLNGIF